MNEQLFELAYGKYVEDVTRGERNVTVAAQLDHRLSLRTRIALALVTAAQRVQPALNWTLDPELPRTAAA